jgi:hypothetical protein
VINREGSRTKDMRGMAGTCPILALKQWWGPKKVHQQVPEWSRMLVWLPIH